MPLPTNFILAETESQLDVLDLAMKASVMKRSATTRLSVTLKQSAHNFEDISYRLGKFGAVWEAVSDHINNSNHVTELNDILDTL